MRNAAITSDRFFAKVMKTPVCWIWTGTQTQTGYGIFGHTDGSSMGAHRWSYEYHVGPIAEWLEIDHLCRVTLCVNPAHLEAVTRDKNQRRAFRAKALIEKRLEMIDLDWPGFLGEFGGAA